MLKRSKQNGCTEMTHTLTNKGGIINPLFDSLPYDSCRHIAHFSYYATHKISARITQLFRKTLPKKKKQVHTTRPKGSMGRSIELLHDCVE